jgi:hypothetical protein
MTLSNYLVLIIYMEHVFDVSLSNVIQLTSRYLYIYLVDVQDVLFVELIFTYMMIIDLVSHHQSQCLEEVDQEMMIMIILLINIILVIIECVSMEFHWVSCFVAF